MHPSPPAALMNGVPRLARPVGLVLGGLAAVVALTWAVEHIIPAPYSGYLAACLVGVAAIELLKRRPGQRALRMFRAYLRARARGAEETAARARLLARFARRDEIRAAAEADWRGDSEKARVIAGVRALLGAERKSLEPDRLAPIYDRVRDQYTIPGWEALPEPFVDEVRRRLDESQWTRLDALARKYQLFRQRFFRSPSALGADPGAGVEDFARLLASLGHRVGREEPADAERAYRLSIALRPAENLAHAGLALLLDRTGRNREAAAEARTALAVLDDYARRAAERDPKPEDIGPFRSPRELRAALERLTGGA